MLALDGPGLRRRGLLRADAITPPRSVVRLRTRLAAVRLSAALARAAPARRWLPWLLAYCSRWRQPISRSGAGGFELLALGPPCAERAPSRSPIRSGQGAADADRRPLRPGHRRPLHPHAGRSAPGCRRADDGVRARGRRDVMSTGVLIVFQLAVVNVPVRRDISNLYADHMQRGGVALEPTTGGL
jgi:hypothetical protein